VILQEKNQVLGELTLKARMTTETLNTIEGVRCNEVMGAMYAFPRIFLPDKAVAEAEVSTTLLSPVRFCNEKQYILDTWGLITKKILRLSYDVIITYDNRKSNLR